MMAETKVYWTCSAFSSPRSSFSVTGCCYITEYMRLLRKIAILSAAGLILGLWVAFAPDVAAEEIVGKPRVVDGDTLDFSGRRVSLFGIDALETGQACGADGKIWACGKEAHWAALNRVSPHWVTCVVEANAGVVEGDGSVAAVCYLAGAGQFDLNAWLVEQGWALADRDASDAYVAAEDAARQAGRGLWRGTFVPPWDWRDGQRLSP
jgi:endonuclease YncB( thermonuclease family)